MMRKEQLAAVAVEDMVVFSPGRDPRLHRCIHRRHLFLLPKATPRSEQLTDKGIEVRCRFSPRRSEFEGAQKLATAWCAEDQQTTLTELKAAWNCLLTTAPTTPSLPNASWVRTWESPERRPLLQFRPYGAGLPPCGRSSCLVRLD